MSTIHRNAAMICLKGGGKTLSVIIGKEKHWHVINLSRAVASVEPENSAPSDKV